MAILTGTADVYSMSGASGVGRHNREDLSDMITNISPTETPFLSSIGSSKATNVYHEWLTHSLAAAVTTTVRSPRRRLRFLVRRKLLTRLA